MSKTPVPAVLQQVFDSYKEIDISSYKLAPKLQQWEGSNSTVVVTEECNLRCTYCYCHKTPDKMSWNTAKAYIDILFDKCKHFADIPKEEQIKNRHRKIFEFIGGEPLLEADLMFRCMNYIINKVKQLPSNHPWKRTDWGCDGCGSNHGLGYTFQISTNGLLLNDKKIQSRLLRYNKELVRIAVTLDGNQEMHDKCRVTTDGGPSWQQVMDAREWLAIHFPDTNKTTKSTIAHENVGYIYEIIKFFYELDMTSVSQNCVFEDVWHEGDQLILFDQLCHVADFLIEDKKYEKMHVRWFDPAIISKSSSDRKWCGAGSYMDCCDYKGIVYPCLRFKTLEKQKPYEMGNTEIWKDEKIVEMFECCGNATNSETQKEISGVDCASCPVSALCADCQALAYDCYGRLDVRTTFICSMHKAAVCANIYFFGKLIGSEVNREYLMYLLAEWTKDDYFLVKDPIFTELGE